MSKGHKPNYAVADAAGNKAKSNIVSTVTTNCSRSSSDVTTSEFRTKEPTHPPTNCRQPGADPNALALATSKCRA